MTGLSVPPEPGCCRGLVAAHGAGKGRAGQQLVRRESRDHHRRADSPGAQELSSLGHAPTLETVQHVLALLLPAWRGNPKASTAVLSHLGKKKKRGWTSLQVIETMRSNQLEVNVFHYSAAISACEKSGQWQSALNGCARYNLLRCSHQCLPKRQSMAVSSKSVELDA